MAKYYGKVGFRITEEIRPAVSMPRIIEHSYAGDVLRNSVRIQSADKVNDDIDISNQISIVADPFARQHFHSIVYVRWMGTAWKVSMVDVQYPRLILTIGGVYNGETNDD